jgi:hypothetical protein
MRNSKESLQDFYYDTIFIFYRMGLVTQGKTLDDVLFDDRGKAMWAKKNTYCRMFGKKLKQLLDEKMR